MRNYQYIMVKLDAIKNCIASGNDQWKDSHIDQLWELLYRAPYIDYVTLTRDKEGYVIFGTVPSEAGMLTFRATVRASLSFGFTLGGGKFLRPSQETIKSYNAMVREYHNEYCDHDDLDCECSEIGQDDLGCYLDMIADWLRDNVPAQLCGAKNE